MNCRKKKQVVAKPIKPDEEETIGEKYADLSSLKQTGNGESTCSLLPVLVSGHTGLGQKTRSASSSAQFGSSQLLSPRHDAGADLHNDAGTAT